MSTYIAPQPLTITVRFTRRESGGGSLTVTSPRLEYRRAQGTATATDVPLGDPTGSGFDESGCAYVEYQASLTLDSGEWHLRARSAEAADLVRPFVQTLNIPTDGF